jgi:predicted nucleotidyltransferase component of viral defense system
MVTPVLSEIQAIEFFHLALLTVLPSTLRPDRYVLKGGANLRFFFGSHRLSEDIDFEVIGGEMWRIEDGLQRSLASDALSRILATGGVSITGHSFAKSTPTTVRAKLGLHVARQTVERRTKVEFSSRIDDDRHVTEAVPQGIAAAYGLRPPIVRRYTTNAAVEQKILALALRGETRARDVFDLGLLLPASRGEIDGRAVGIEILETAAVRAGEITFEDFESQVLAYVDPAFAHLHQSPRAWKSMQSEVVNRLRAAVPGTGARGPNVGPTST